MCSGLTAYSALKRIAEHAKRGPVLLVGLGGVGMMGLAFALALFPHKPIVADIDAAKREAALKAGAAAAYDPADPAARKALIKATGGVARRGRFRRLGRLARFRDGRAREGRQGRHHRADRRHLHDADRDVSAQGDDASKARMTGTLDEANEMMALARAGKIPPVPIIERPLSAAQASLDDLRAGKIVGRVVLAP